MYATSRLCQKKGSQICLQNVQKLQHLSMANYAKEVGELSKSAMGRLGIVNPPHLLHP